MCVCFSSQDRAPKDDINEIKLQLLVLSNHQFPKARISLITSCLLFILTHLLLTPLDGYNISGFRINSISDFKHLPENSLERSP